MKRNFKLEQRPTESDLCRPSLFLDFNHMNKKRRKEIENLRESISETKAKLQDLLDEEQQAFDNMPESIQESERGEEMQEIIEYMEAAIDSLEGATESLTEIQ